MDAIDRKLLAALLKDSRQSLTQLGKAAGIARENAHYRIQKLQETGVIRAFVTHIDYRALGFDHFTLFIQYGKITGEEEQALLERLRTHRSLSWLGVLAGKMSLTADIYARTLSEANTIIDTLLEHFAEHIESYQLLHNEEDAFYLEKLVEGGIIPPKKTSSKPDDTDRNILRILADNSRASYVELGVKTGLSANGIKKRILTLEQRGIIQSYGVSLDHRMFGFEWNGLQVRAAHPDTKARQRLTAFCKEHPRILFMYSYSRTGSHDYDIGVIMKDSRELRVFINDFRTRFADRFTITELFLVLEEYTSHNLPPAVFDDETPGKLKKR